MAWQKDYGKSAKIAADEALLQAQRAEVSADYIDAKQPLIDEFTGEQTNLQTQLNDLVLQSGTDIAEVVQARGGFPTVNARLTDTNTRQNVLIKKTSGIIPVSNYDSVSSAVTAASSGSTLYFEPGVVYDIPEIIIQKALHFLGYQAKLIPTSIDSPFRIDQNVDISKIIFEGFDIEGDGTINFAQQGIVTNFSGATIRKAIIRNVNFKNLPFGIYLNSATAGVQQSAEVTGCNFENMVGGATGTGLGIALSGGESVPLMAYVANNVFDNCYRHASYVSQGSQVNFIGNTYKNHRLNNADGASISLGALQITRCKNIKAIGNTFENNAEASIHVGTGSPMGQTDTIQILGNNFINSRRFDISVGSDDPDTNGVTKNIKISDNKFKHKSDNIASSVYVQSAQNLKITENEWDAKDLTVTNYGLIKLFALGTANPSGSYEIKRNTINMNTSVTTRAIAPDNAILTGTQKVDITDNEIIATTPIQLGVGVTNPNFRYATKNSMDVNVNTAGATLTTLETEVNELKQALRDVGLMRRV